MLYIRGCLHDTGTSFILVRVHPGSYLSLCICLHDTGEKSHTSTTHTGEFIPVVVPDRNSHNGMKSYTGIM